MACASNHSYYPKSQIYIWCRPAQQPQKVSDRSLTWGTMISKQGIPHPRRTLAGARLVLTMWIYVEMSSWVHTTAVTRGTCEDLPQHAGNFSSQVCSVLASIQSSSFGSGCFLHNCVQMCPPALSFLPVLCRSELLSHELMLLLDCLICTTSKNMLHPCSIQRCSAQGLPRRAKMHKHSCICGPNISIFLSQVTKS